MWRSGLRSRFHYVQFDELVNVKYGVWEYVYLLIIGLRSSTQQLSITWYQMVWLYTSICPFTGGMWDDISVIIDLRADIILCRSLLKWKLCAFWVGADTSIRICILPGGMWAICNAFKVLWYDIVVQRSAGKCSSYKRFISLCIFITKRIIFLKPCSAHSLYTDTSRIFFSVPFLIWVPGETNLITLSCRRESVTNK